MGCKNSRPFSNRLSILEAKIKGLIYDTQALNDEISECSETMINTNEFAPRMMDFENEVTSATDKIAQLADLLGEQKKVIIDISSQSIEIAKDLENQQAAINSIVSECEERSRTYEEELAEANQKVLELESGLEENTQLANSIGVKKNENMIKKTTKTDTKTTRRNTRRSKADKETSQRYIEIPEEQENNNSYVTIEMNDEGKKENEKTSETHNAIVHDKIVRKVVKETLAVIDINTLQ